MRGNFDGKTADEVRADLRRVIRAAKEVRDSSYDFNDKYNELLRYGVYYAKDTFKEDRDERRKERIKLNMYDVRELAKILGTKVYYKNDGTDKFPWTRYFYFEDAVITSCYASKDLKEEEING